ncbi:MAG: HD domain-containing protein [Desulfobulbaceae bacterium]|nr:HD domain-containing protein [Desulfobulbaceae bacterium]
MKFKTDPNLIEMRELLDGREDKILSSLATRSCEAVRRNQEEKAGHRQAFSVDTDRILNSRSYTRYIDKTQVFYMIANDHITHRVLHVQLVSKIARTIGRFMGLNEDLIEAIALGHDIGHPPFGHDGEKLLSELCVEHGLAPFHHNIQSAVYLDRIERDGRGWNLSLQTLDGILFHDGEIHSDELRPFRTRDFVMLDGVIEQVVGKVPVEQTMPMTLEGCLVRLCDTIGYIGRDIEDAIELDLICRDDLPSACTEVLGNTNGTIVYRLVADLIKNGCKDDRIFFSPVVSAALKNLKKFNYEQIYLDPVIKRGFGDIKNCYRTLFEIYLDDLHHERQKSVIFTEFLERMEKHYLAQNSAAAMVRDFIAGMTDNYFMAQAGKAGCRIPSKLARPLVD